MNLRKLICVVGLLASVGLAILSLPSHFMATPMEAKAYQIMQDGLKQEVGMGRDSDEVVLMSHYAHSNAQEWVMKSRVMLSAATVFFVLFLVLLILDVKKGKPTSQSNLAREPLAG